jgi:GT2 family glycosyltransferase
VTTSAIATAIVSYGTREELRACLSALASEPRHDVIVVDNASPDGSAAMVRAEFPWVQLLENDENRGYGAAANQGFAASAADYLVLLNADVVPQPGALANLVQYLDDHPRAAIAAPRLLNPDGTAQPSCYPFLTPGHVLVVMSGLNSLLSRLFPRAHRHLGTSPQASTGRVSWVKGAALAIRASAFDEVAGFDESFFLYGEEHDLCYRLAQAGWETHFTTGAAMIHVEGASSRGRETVVSEYVFGSLVHFYGKHFSRGRLLRLRLVLAALMAARIIRDTLLLWGARDARKRSELRGSLLVWRRVLLGRLSQTPTTGS